MGTEVNILVTLSSGIWALNERGMKEHSGAIKIYTFFLSGGYTTIYVFVKTSSNVHL